MTAINAIVQSAYSNVASAAVPILPAVPTTFTAANAANSGGQRNVEPRRWTANTANVTGFTIQRSASVDLRQRHHHDQRGAQCDDADGLRPQPEHVYYFRIRANDGSLSSRPGG